MFKSHSVRVALSVALLGASIMTPGVMNRASAQPNLLQVPKVQVRVEPQLQAHLLATKLKVSSAVLDQSFVLRDGVPAIKLADGSERLLLPVEELEKPVAATNEVPGEVKDVQSYALAPADLGKVRAKIFQVNPNIFIALGVDHRSKMTPIRDQGPRGTCVAFATNGALEPFISINNDLSEQYSYHQFMAYDNRPFNYNGGTYLTTATAVLAQGTVAENVWPYSNSIPAANEAVPAGVAGATKYKITNATHIANNGLSGVSIRNTNYVESLLRAGYNIVIGSDVAWQNSAAPGVIDVVIDPATNQPAASRGGHAMVIVGYNASQDYFIVRNSWGSGYGHAGYLYLSYDYARTYFRSGFIIKGVAPRLFFRPDVIKINPNIRVIPR